MKHNEIGLFPNFIIVLDILELIIESISLQ